MSAQAFVMTEAPSARTRPATEQGHVVCPSPAGGGGAGPAVCVAFVAGLVLLAVVVGGLFATLAAPAELAPIDAVWR